MVPSLLRKVNFDSAPPFRRHPWLYGLIIVLSIGIGLLLVFGAWYGLQSRKQIVSSQPPSGPVETPGERTNRVAIMNILNTFHKDESALSEKDPLEKRKVAQEEHVKSVVDRLEAIKTEDSMKSAQDELLVVFKQWDEKLAAGSTGSDLKPAFVTIAQRYPWLNTLVWIIILNRL